MRKNNFLQDEESRLDLARTKFASVLKRHGELAERLSRDSDKMVFERLQREFEAARVSQTQEICLDGEQWNDGLLATIRERVHMEVERKTMQLPGEVSMMTNQLPFHDKVTYKVANKSIHLVRHIPSFEPGDLLLGGARIGILYETSFAGEPCEVFHCVLESKSFLEKMTVVEHTVPFFLPIREAENEFLSSNAMKFIDHVGELLQAFVDRREQVRLIKELYGNQIKELYNSLPYHLVEFVIDDYNCKVTVSLRYADLVSILPTAVSVLAWPKQSDSLTMTTVMSRRSTNKFVPERLSYAEDALKIMSLPEAYAEIVLNLSQALQEIFSPDSSSA